MREKKEEVDVLELVYRRRHQGRHEVGLKIVCDETKSGLNICYDEEMRA